MTNPTYYTNIANANQPAQGSNDVTLAPIMYAPQAGAALALGAAAYDRVGYAARNLRYRGTGAGAARMRALDLNVAVNAANVQVAFAGSTYQVDRSMFASALTQLAGRIGQVQLGDLMLSRQSIRSPLYLAGRGRAAARAAIWLPWAQATHLATQLNVVAASAIGTAAAVIS